MTSARPPRKAIPIAVKRVVAERQGWVCRCGCGMVINLEPGSGVRWDHRPPLRLRAINASGTDYDPPQHSADHLDAICDAEHHSRTHGTGSTTAGSDIGLIKKFRKIETKRKFVVKKKPIGGDGERRYGKDGSRLACQSGGSRWPAQKLQSRGFEKRHRPIRGFGKHKGG